MAPKPKTPVKSQSAPGMVVYTDNDGNEVQLPAITSYQDTDFYKNTQVLFPHLEQATFARTDQDIYDPEGRPNLTGKNIILVRAIQMTKGPHGPYYACHVLADGLQTETNPNGEYSVLSRGNTVQEFIEKVSGIELATGRTIGKSELPVLFRVLFAAGEGEHEGYYYMAPPAEKVEVD